MAEINDSWTQRIPVEEWRVYKLVLDELNLRGIPFALGGAFGVAAYTGRWRNTKDLDIFVTPDRREEIIEILAHQGLKDYYDLLPYVRDWIYRSYIGDIIVDFIWAMANQCANVDPDWLNRGKTINVKGMDYRVIPPEELVWAKIFVMQKERCDWPDIFNVLSAVGPEMDWAHLLERFDKELPLLRAVMSVFGWLDPAKAKQFPAWLWDRIGTPAPSGESSMEDIKFRADLLDTRPWFLPLLS